VEEVAHYLGNTPTIAKNSYIDPRVIDLYENGTTIDPALVSRKYRSPAAKQRTLEAAVLDLLS
jgi:DNA topoisomerase-1